ncbi:MAG: hypothetical protein U0791_26905 [Gemmataceae bacterium]
MGEREPLTISVRAFDLHHGLHGQARMTREEQLSRLATTIADDFIHGLRKRDSGSHLLGFGTVILRDLQFGGSRADAAGPKVLEAFRILLARPIAVLVALVAHECSALHDFECRSVPDAGTEAERT